MSVHDIEKARAKKLAALLNEKGFEVPHMAALDIIAKMEGFKNWNTYHKQLDARSKLNPIPKGWTLGGDRREQYIAGCDPTERFDGKPVLVLQHKPNVKENTEGFATITQKIFVDDYRNTTVHFSAFLKVLDCDGAATIWLRADDYHNMPIAFDNLEMSESQSPLTGRTGWIKREIVLNIPQNAHQLAFGYYLRGHGTAYGAQFKLSSTHEEPHDTKQIDPHTKELIDLSFNV